MAAVQFFGIENVINAANNFNCPAWGIFINRSLFMKYEGDDMTESIQMLQESLQALEPSGTAAIYTLKFFECEPGTKIKITEKSTVTGGSFNFKLLEPEQREQMYLKNSVNFGAIGDLNRKVDKLEEMFVQFMNRDEITEEEEEPETLGSVLVQAVKNPDELMKLINVGKMILGIPITNQVPANVIGNVPGQASQPAQAEPVQYDAQIIERLQTAINTLEKHDKKLVEHLEKLAAIAEKDKGTFNFLLGMLDKQ